MSVEWVGDRAELRYQGAAFWFRYLEMPGNCGVGIVYDLIVQQRDMGLSAEEQKKLYELMRKGIIRKACLEDVGKILFSDNVKNAEKAISWMGFAEFVGALHGTIVPNPNHDNETRIQVFEWDMPIQSI